MEKNQDKSGIPPTDPKVYQPATTKETTTKTTATEQTSNPAINKGKQQGTLLENNPLEKQPATSGINKISDTPETPKREEEQVKSQPETWEEKKTAPVSADGATAQEQVTETEQKGAE